MRLRTVADSFLTTLYSIYHHRVEYPGFDFEMKKTKKADKEKAPKGFDLKQLLKDAALGGSYDSLRGFHYNSLFVGSMWFQDAFNLNVDRLQRCVIHYTTLEGIVPFCRWIPMFM